jgi:hypothetical protein
MAANATPRRLQLIRSMQFEERNDIELTLILGYEKS